MDAGGSQLCERGSGSQTRSWRGDSLCRMPRLGMCAVLCVCHHWVPSVPPPTWGPQIPHEETTPGPLQRPPRPLHTRSGSPAPAPTTPAPAPTTPRARSTPAPAPLFDKAEPDPYANPSTSPLPLPSRCFTRLGRRHHRIVPATTVVPAPHQGVQELCSVILRHLRPPVQAR